MENEQTPMEKLEHELHVALCDNDPAAVRAAIERGADPNSTRLYRHSTPLDFVTFHGKPESLAVLLEHGATVPRDALEAMGQWEIVDGMTDDEDMLRYLPVAQALLERGADPNVKVDEGKSLAEYWSWLPPPHRLFADAIAQTSALPENPAT